MLEESRILENSIIIIEYKDGTCKPYYVSTKWIGAITGATMLLGYLIDDLVSNVKSYGLKKLWPITKGHTDCYCIGDKRVKNYRFPNEEEKSKIKKLLQSVGLNEAANILTEDKSETLSVDEIKEKKIIVITDTNNQRIPFYVFAVDTAKTIRGLPVEDIIKDNIWPIKPEDCCIFSGEIKFSKLTTIENLKLKVVLLNNKLSELAACI